MGKVKELLGKLWEKLTNEKCEYSRTCEHYTKDSRVCNVDGGRYYGIDKGASCWKEHKIRENDNQIEVKRIGDTDKSGLRERH